MKTMTISIERRPTTHEVDEQEIQVEELGVRLAFARKPVDLKDMCTSGEDVVYVQETRMLSAEDFDAFAGNLLASRDWLRTVYSQTLIAGAHVHSSLHEKATRSGPSPGRSTLQGHHAPWRLVCHGLVLEASDGLVGQ